MNLYLLLEGERTEKKIYESWIGHAFPALRLAARIEDVSDDCYRLLSGDGYPQILGRIEEALAEMASVSAQFDHFFICLDADGRESLERKQAVIERLDSLRPAVPATVVVQNCCIETWFLGNRVFVPKQPRDPDLITFRRFYDVRDLDPELMPAMPPVDVAQPQQFHLKYLKACFRDHGLSYNKSRPVEVGERHYLEQLILRAEETGHLASFGELASAWRGLGAFGQQTPPQESR